jgi:hypothetical protein
MSPTKQLSISETLADCAEKRWTAQKTFIDRVITVSTGALAFSVTFRSVIAGADVTHIWLLKCAWIGLAVCSICGVLVHLTPASSYKRFMSAMEKGEPTIAMAAHPFYNVLYVLILFCFPVSLAALAAFGVVNCK